MKQAKKFPNVFWFIYDFTWLSEIREFKWSLKKIHRPDLVVKKENLSQNEILPLDLFIKIDNNKFSMQLHDKKDNFLFSIVRIPYFRSNVASTVFYST